MRFIIILDKMLTVLHAIPCPFPLRFGIMYNTTIRVLCVVLCVWYHYTCVVCVVPLYVCCVCGTTIRVSCVWYHYTCVVRVCGTTIRVSCVWYHYMCVVCMVFISIYHVEKYQSLLKNAC